MATPDYYKILQVSPNASTAEIKAAYRRLAKIYHPDKSGSYADEEQFKLIKEAYENLVDPQKRARYNARINRATTFSHTSANTGRQGKRRDTFTEAEAKRRQYYQEHYKKAYGSRQNQEPPPAKHPNELKYILISVPVAVALLLLIIRIYEKPEVLTKEPETEIALDTLSDIRTPASPYSGLFGRTMTDSASLAVMRIENRSGADAIVFVRDSASETVRHHFIANNYEVLVEQLPRGPYHLYYWLGKHFTFKNFLFGNIIGSFRQTLAVDSVHATFTVAPGTPDTFRVTLANSGKRDSSLLRRIFSIK